MHEVTDLTSVVPTIEPCTSCRRFHTDAPICGVSVFIHEILHAKTRKISVIWKTTPTRHVQALLRLVLSTGEPRDLTFYRARIHSVLLAQEEHRLLRSSARALFRQSSSASGCFPLHRAIPVFDSNVKHLSSERAHIAPPRCAWRTLHPTAERSTNWIPRHRETLLAS